MNTPLRERTKSPRVGALPGWQRLAVNWTALAVWLTGAVWLIFKYFVRSVDEFGFENPHPQQQAWIIAHAFVSLAGLWLFGLLWSQHIVRGWDNRVRRPSGSTIFVAVAWLSLTGCALYYLGSDRWRSWVSFAHWIPGLAALIAFHVHRRKRTRAVSAP